MTIPHPLQESNTEDDIENFIGVYPPRAALPDHRLGGDVHGLNNSGKFSPNPNLSKLVSFREANLDNLMSDPTLRAVKIDSGPPSKLDSYTDPSKIVSIPELPGFTGGTLEPLVTISPSVPAEADDYSLSISPTSAETWEAEGDALSRNDGDTLNQMELGVERLADDQLGCYCKLPFAILGTCSGSQY